MLFVCAIVFFSIATQAGRIRNQTPSWKKWEPIRVYCSESKGKGRCYDYCQNKGQLTTIQWLEENCLPRLEYDDAFMIERRREYPSRWATVYSGTPSLRLYIDARNTTIRRDIYDHPENVVRLLLVSPVTKSIQKAGAVSVWDTRSLTEEQKGLSGVQGYATAPNLTLDVVDNLPSLLHPEHTEIYPYALGLSRFAINLTQAFIWHWTEFPEDLIIEIPSATALRLKTGAFLDVSERVWIRQTDKCQAYPDCRSCSSQVNCDWCLLANLTFACRGFCTGPWREDNCGVEPLFASVLALCLYTLLS